MTKGRLKVVTQNNITKSKQQAGETVVLVVDHIFFVFFNIVQIATCEWEWELKMIAVFYDNLVFLIIKFKIFSYFLE